jgi:predicted PurR-regulated permease PerM
MWAAIHGMQTTKNTATAALTGIWRVAFASFTIAALHVGRDVLIPLALAGLLTFVLSPVVTRLARWIGRGAAVFSVVAMLFLMIGVMGWVLAHQLVDVGTKLPNYQVNIENKLRAFRVPSGGALNRLSQMAEDLKKEVPAPQAANCAPSASPSSTPVPVRVVDSTTSVGLPGLVQKLVVFVVGPLGKTAIVLWGTTENQGKVGDRLRASGADAIALSLAKAAVHLGSLCGEQT